MDTQLDPVFHVPPFSLTLPACFLGLGVGAVISGEFYGWNLALHEGGIGGLIVASAIAAVLYFGLTYSLGEMAAALPVSGGSYAYARAVLGPWGGFFAGLCENWTYQLFTGLILVAAGDFICEMAGLSEDLAPLWWLILLGVFMALHILSQRALWLMLIVFSAVPVLLIAIYAVVAAFYCDWDRWVYTVTVDHNEWGASLWFPKGALGVVKGLPGAIWWFTDLECIVLASDEAKSPLVTVPRGLQWSYYTLLGCAIVLTPLGSAVPLGAKIIGASPYPIVEFFTAITSEHYKPAFIALMFPGLFANFHALMFAYTRQTYALSRAGYLPKFLSITAPVSRTPIRSLLIASFYSYTSALIMYFLRSSTSVAEILLNLTVLSAVIVYAIVALSFVLLRYKLPNLHRPFVSPIGVPGAVFSLVISATTIIVLLALQPSYRVTVIIFVSKIVGFAIYFGVWSRNRLAASPDEEFIQAKLEEERLIRESKMGGLANKVAPVTIKQWKTPYQLQQEERYMIFVESIETIRDLNIMRTFSIKNPPRIELPRTGDEIEMANVGTVAAPRQAVAAEAGEAAALCQQRTPKPTTEPDDPSDATTIVRRMLEGSVSSTSEYSAESADDTAVRADDSTPTIRSATALPRE